LLVATVQELSISTKCRITFDEDVNVDVWLICGHAKNIMFNCGLSADVNLAEADNPCMQLISAHLCQKKNPPSYESVFTE